MKNFILLPLLILATLHDSTAQDVLFDKIDSFLKVNLKNGFVDYESISNNPESLNEIIKEISSYNLSEATSQSKIAFYINAYNMVVIYSVIKFYPIKSPRDIKGFFTEYQYLVAGEKLTLDQIEFEKLFGQFPDVRYHFVLNCAAKSCPTLYSEAFRPAVIEEQLMFGLLTVIDRDDFVQIDNKNKRVLLSKIFEWYRIDFEKEFKSIETFIRNYRFDRIPPGYSLAFMEYDWTLNDTKNALIKK